MKKKKKKKQVGRLKSFVVEKVMDVGSSGPESSFSCHTV